MQRRKKGLILALIAILLVSSLRMIAIDRFAAVDEPAWLIKSANFYYALGQREFDRTVYDYKPAVPSMWIITSALLSYFPEYRGQGQGYFTKYSDFSQFLESYGKQALELLKRSRLITLVLNATLLLLAFLLFYPLIGIEGGLLCILLITLDPYFAGHSRLLNHEALTCLFLLVSILGLLAYLEWKNIKLLLVLSGAAAGLGLLTKSSTTLVLPFAFLMVAVHAWEAWRESQSLRRLLKEALVTLLIWLAALIFTYVVVWPGMWVDPVKMLYEVYGNAFSYAFQGQGLAVTQGLDPEGFQLESGGIFLYLKSLLWGTTPLVWLGVILASVSSFIPDKRLLNRLSRKVIVYFGLLAVLFILQFGIASGRNSAHYILASYMSLDVVAGVGFLAGLNLLAGKFKTYSKPIVKTGILVGLLLFQGVSTASQFPYYYTYSNPLMTWLYHRNANPNLGYGEGLDRAAVYLSQKPDSKDLTSMSWYGYGPFSYFFTGGTVPLLGTERLDQKSTERLSESDYLVIYSINQVSRNLPENLMFALDDLPPERVIKMNGREYIRIFKVDQLPESFYTALKENR